METKIKSLLEHYGIDDQRTAAWHAKRGEMLTASEIWKCFGNASASARQELILSKLQPRKGGDAQVGALVWGTRFEPIAKEIYCHLEGVKLEELTCVRHPTHEFLGASPDGLVISQDERLGRLVEFKCPISRNFTEDSPVPEEYYHQMQLQMECTDLQECDYVEFKFKTMNYSEWVMTQAPFKSFFAVSESGEVKYRGIGDSRLETWASEELGESWHESWQIIYWVIVVWRKKLVARDSEWMSTHFPEMKATWEEIMMHRNAGTLPEKSKGILTL